MTDPIAQLLEIASEAPPGRWSAMNRRGLADVYAIAPGTTGHGELVAICFNDDLNEDDIRRGHRTADWIAACSPDVIAALCREIVAARKVTYTSRRFKGDSLDLRDALDNYDRVVGSEKQ